MGRMFPNKIEANLFQRLWEAGKGEATPDARPGEIGEAELDLGGWGLRNKSFVEGGRVDSLKSVGPHKIEVKDLKEGGGKINVVGGGFSAWRPVLRLGRNRRRRRPIQ